MCFIRLGGHGLPGRRSREGASVLPAREAVKRIGIYANIDVCANAEFAVCGLMARELRRISGERGIEP